VQTSDGVVGKLSRASDYAEQSLACRFGESEPRLTDVKNSA
jgi:hypothetical protein